MERDTVELGTWVRIEDGSLADGQVGWITRLPGDAPRGCAREGEGFPYYGVTVRSLTESLVELWMLPDETMLYRDVKQSCISTHVLGARQAFFAYWMLSDGRTASQLSSPELLEAVPRRSATRCG